MKAATLIASLSEEKERLRAIVHAVGEARDEAGYLGTAAECIADLSARAYEAAKPAPAGAVAVEDAARILYYAFNEATDLPPHVFDAAGKGHFFSALRLLFEPDADLRQPLSALAHPAPAAEGADLIRMIATLPDDFTDGGNCCAGKAATDARGKE